MTERHNSLLFDRKNYVFMSKEKHGAANHVFMSKELCLYVEKKG